LYTKQGHTKVWIPAVLAAASPGAPCPERTDVPSVVGAQQRGCPASQRPGGEVELWQSSQHS